MKLFSHREIGRSILAGCLSSAGVVCFEVKSLSEYVDDWGIFLLLWLCQASCFAMFIFSVILVRRGLLDAKSKGGSVAKEDKWGILFQTVSFFIALVLLYGLCPDYVLAIVSILIFCFGIKRYFRTRGAMGIAFAIWGIMMGIFVILSKILFCYGSVWVEL